jgi:hypothetical protein
MNGAPLTLIQFFSLQNEALLPDRLSTLESSGQVSAVKEAAEKQAKGVGWGIIKDQIFEKLKDLLAVGIPDILVAAWNKYEILLKYLDREKYPPNESFLVPLAEHCITSEHHPYVEILVNDQPVGKIGFDIKVALTLEGIILKIQDGKIKEIFTGTCKGKGTISCDNVLILEEKTEAVPLPGSIDLGQGIPIAPLAQL